MYNELGIVAGAAIAFVIMVLIIRMIRKATHQEGIWTKYDERQQIARGKGYRFAFFAMLILNAVAMCWYSVTEGREVQFPVTQAFLGIMIAGVLVYVSYAIWTDAYIGTNETFRSSVILIAVVGAINLAFGLIGLSGDESNINLAIGVMMGIICLEMIAKNQYNKRFDDSSEE